ncbi:hypothetical protein ACV07N_15675 [Roseivirga echinicomitans]
MEDIFREDLNTLSNEELVQAFNNQVGDLGWTSSRGKYLFELRETMKCRGIGMLALSTDSTTSYKYKVKLVDMKLVPLIV